MTAPSRGAISAVVVSHNPDAGFAARVLRVREQVGCVVVVDNASSETSRASVRLAANIRDVHLLRNPRNLGVATALNQGIAWAARQGYALVVTLDQDSVAAPDMVEQLVQVLQDCGTDRPVGMVGANYRDTNTGKIALGDTRTASTRCMERSIVITSGSLLPLQVYERAGPFRDDLFIDQVDNEYCLRLRSHGYRVLISTTPLMGHSIGHGRLVSILGKRVACMNQPASRKYYATRNRLMLFRQYMLREPFWTLDEIRRMYQEALLIILFEDGKLRKLRGMLLGIIHYLRGITGPLAPDAGL